MSDPRERTKGVEIDPRNGFEVIWTFKPDESRKYSLVRVPIDVPVRITYTKIHRSGASFKLYLIPFEPRIWKVIGTLDPETLINLGFCPIEANLTVRGAIFTDENIELLEEYGITKLSQKNELFKARSARLPVFSIYTFLSNTWRPDFRELGSLSRPVPIVLGESVNGNKMRTSRILPQQDYRHPDGSEQRLQIERFS